MTSTSGARERISIADCIDATRIRSTFGSQGRVACFSPDGSRWATVVWRGDRSSGRNVYSLLVVGSDDLARAIREPVLSVDYVDDPDDQHASPIADLQWLPDGEGIAFLGAVHGEARQVHALDLRSRTLRALTSHDSDVREYALAPDGSVAIWSAVATPNALDAPHETAGHSLSARLSPTHPMAAFIAAFAADRYAARRWFVATPDAMRLVQDSESILAPGEIIAFPSLAADRSLLGLACLSVSPAGDRAVIWPLLHAEHRLDLDRWEGWINAVHRARAAPYGVVDLASGDVEPLLRAPRDGPASWHGAPVWSADGRRVLVHSRLPDDAAAPQSLLEVDVVSRTIVRTNAHPGWAPIRWTADELVLASPPFGSVAFGKMRRTDDGWSGLERIDLAVPLHGGHAPAFNGRIVVGVQDAPTTPPELVVHDPAVETTHVVTDLNPTLRRREHAPIERVGWTSSSGAACSGDLVRPLGWSEDDGPFPLAILFNDGDPFNDAYLIDGRLQLSGFAVQPLAASGIGVLFTGPTAFGRKIDTPLEGEHVREHVESAVDMLAARGLVDSGRVALSGWSRAAYWTNAVVIHSERTWACATLIDGGACEYVEGMRQWTTDELHRIRTPLLLEAHGALNGAWMAIMTDRMRALGLPHDLWVLPAAAHNAKRPLDRWTSLNVHLDWFRFWLLDEEDRDPSKASTYERWRAMRGGATRTT